jgi:hypothetical protein
LLHNFSFTTPSKNLFSPNSLAKSQSNCYRFLITKHFAILPLLQFPLIQNHLINGPVIVHPSISSDKSPTIKLQFGLYFFALPVCFKIFVS